MLGSEFGLSQSMNSYPRGASPYKAMTFGPPQYCNTGFVLPFLHASHSISSFAGDSFSHIRRNSPFSRRGTKKRSSPQPFALRSVSTARLSNKTGNRKRTQSVQQSEYEPRRLQTVLAQMGFASRRGAEKLIEGGHVLVNNRRVTQQGKLVVPGKDTIHVNGKLVTLQESVWVAVHKPRGMNSLPSRKRRSVDSNIPSEHRKGLIPVAGMEENASGLLILSNDRTAVAELNDPDNDLVKEWIVDCYGQVPKSKVNALQRGVELEGEDEVFRPKNLQCLGSGYVELSPREKALLTRFVVRVRKHRRQLMSRMFSAVGLTVARASRRALGPVLLYPLKRGDFRYLTPNEIKALRRGVKEGTVMKENRQRKFG